MKFFLLITLMGLNSAAIPPETWQENWFEHNQTLTRTYYDDQVAIYFDPDVDRSITWVNQFMHDVWVYVKKVYGKFGEDPILYVIFHTNKYGGGHPGTQFDSKKEYRNAIDVGLTYENAWKEKTDNELDLIVGSVALIVQNSAHGVDSCSACSIYGHAWGTFFVYDVLLGINYLKEAQKMQQRLPYDTFNFPKADTYWFRDWFIPIYENHGHSSVLNRFFELSANFFPKSNTASFGRPRYSRSMNMGEFVHFWSGAARTDLKSLAEKAFGWTDAYEDELNKAKTEFGEIVYYDVPEFWKENLFGDDTLLRRHYYDNEIAVYFDPEIDKSTTWISKYVNDVWGYVKKNYGDFGNNRLYALFHKGGDDGYHSANYLRNGNLSRNVIDCSLKADDAWKMDQSNELDLIAESVGAIVQNSSHGILGCPPCSLWREKFIDIFVYDLYTTNNRQEDADRWYDSKIAANENYPREKTFWFKNWFLPIYEQYGGSKVLARFFELLAVHFPKDGRKYGRSMNFGEFVLFWSGAAEIILKGLANEAFGWDEQNEKEFRQALKDFPNISYRNIILL